MIAFSCPHCSLKLQVKPEFAGRKAACPTCKQPLTVPSPDRTQAYVPNEKIDVSNNSLVEDYHTFGVDVSPQAIVFFLDGKRIWSHPTPAELTYPLYPLVNLALGSGWPIDKTPNPSTLLVDYVHVYGRDAGPPEGCPAGPPPVSR